MKKPKIALIGAGRWGKKLLSELVNLTDVQTIITRGSKETDIYIKENYPLINLSSDLNTALSNPSIEAVFVATPTQTHFEIAEQIIHSNKHLFLEKPGTTSSGDLQKLCQKAEDKGLTIAVGYEFAHHSALKKIKDNLANDKIKSIDMEWFKWGTFVDQIPAHLLSHEVSVIKMLSDKPLNPQYFKEKGVISNSDITYTEFNTGEININSVINRVSTEKRKTVTICTNDKTYIWNNNDLFLINKQSESLEPIQIDSNSAISNEISDFIAAINEGRQPLTNGKFALEVYKTVEHLI